MAKLLKDGREMTRQTGEVQFAEYGLSGIPVMQLSNQLGQNPGKGWTVELDLLPDLERMEIVREIGRRIARGPQETLETLLAGTVHKRLGYAAIKAAGLGPLSRQIGELRDAERERLAAALKGLPFPITGPLGWPQAQVTGGGVPLGEINPLTMESRRVPGLYLCGELLDAVGDCGGFNLHWAWTTGLRAGRASAQY